MCVCVVLCVCILPSKTRFHSSMHDHAKLLTHLCDGYLFICNVARDLDDFHSVLQRAWDGISHVGSANEQHLEK